MSKHLDDELLYAHVPEAEEAMLCALTEEEHVFSHRFARKMRRLLRYERRGRFGRTATLAGRAVAAVLAAVLALNLILAGTVEAYREEFFEIVATVTKEFTSYFVKVEDNTPVRDFTPIDPPYIPEGFEEAEHFSNETTQIITYLNYENKDITVTQTVLGAAPIRFDTEDAHVEVLQLQSYEVHVITENTMTQVFFVAGGYEFTVSGTAGYEEILEVTENILKISEK